MACVSHNMNPGGAKRVIQTRLWIESNRLPRSGRAAIEGCQISTAHQIGIDLKGDRTLAVGKKAGQYGSVS